MSTYIADFPQKYVSRITCTVFSLADLAIFTSSIRFAGFLNLYLTIIPSLQVLTTNMWLNLNWMDTQLTWNAVSKRIA